MKHHILKLALGLLTLGALGFAGYRFMQRNDRVEIQSAQESVEKAEMEKDNMMLETNHRPIYRK
jgi:hypothetical protein